MAHRTRAVADGGHDLVELVGPGDQRRRQLDHGVAAVVGPADQAELEQPGREHPAQQALATRRRRTSPWSPGPSPVRCRRSTPSRGSRRRSAGRPASRARRRNSSSLASTRPTRSSLSNTSRLASATAQLTGMAAEGDAVEERRAGLEERLGDVVADHHAAERRVARGEALGHGDHVGLVAEPLGRRTSRRAGRTRRSPRRTRAARRSGRRSRAPGRSSRRTGVKQPPAFCTGSR